MADHITETPDGLRFVKAKGGTKIHLLPKGQNAALCGHNPTLSRVRLLGHMLPRGGWWLVRINMVQAPAWCEKCQQARPLIRRPLAASRDAFTAAGERLRLALLDQGNTPILADHSQVVAPAAAGAREVQPEAVDVGLDLPEPSERLAAADALEHGPGIRAEHDEEVTDHG